jgi:hypothetical protein
MDVDADHHKIRLDLHALGDLEELAKDSATETGYFGKAILMGSSVVMEIALLTLLIVRSISAMWCSTQK